jgi:hypothetical protein
MQIKKNEVGITYGEFQDSSGHTCSIQESSKASEPCIWLGVNDAAPTLMCRDAALIGMTPETDVGTMPYPIPEEVNLHTRMELSQEQVRDLLPALQHFAETGELPTGSI